MKNTAPPLEIGRKKCRKWEDFCFADDENGINSNPSSTRDEAERNFFGPKKKKNENIRKIIIIFSNTFYKFWNLDFWLL